MKKVLLVPTNFSDESQHSIHFAIDMAADLGASVRLFHVVDDRSYLPELKQPDRTSAALVESAWNQIGRVELGAQRYAGERVDVASSVRLGEFDSAIDGMCEDYQPFAVIMNSRWKAGPIARFFLGNSVLAAVRASDIPLIVVPPGAIYKGIKVIGLACDLHDAEQLTPIQQVEEWASAFHASLDILNVFEGDWGLEGLEATRLGASRLRSAFGAALPACHFIYSRSIEKGLFNYALKNDVDLLAIFPRERFRFWALFEKGHSGHMALRPPVPIVIMHR